MTDIQTLAGETHVNSGIEQVTSLISRQIADNVQGRSLRQLNKKKIVNESENLHGTV